VTVQLCTSSCRAGVSLCGGWGSEARPDLVQVIVQLTSSCPAGVSLCRGWGSVARPDLVQVTVQLTSSCPAGVSLCRGWGSEANCDGAGPGPDFSVWRPWAGSLLEAPVILCGHVLCRKFSGQVSSISFFTLF